MGTITIASDGLFTRQHLEHARPPLLFECANLCRRNGDFRDAQTHAQPRAGGVSPPWLGNARVAETANLQQTRIRATQDRGDVSPPWLGNTSGVLEKSSTVQRHATDNQERGERQPPVVRRNAFAMPPRNDSEHYRRSPGDRDCNDVRRHTGGSLLHVCAIALANAFPHTTAGSRPPLLFAGANVCR